jgi:hypothetical protein
MAVVSDTTIWSVTLGASLNTVAEAEAVAVAESKGVTYNRH